MSSLEYGRVKHRLLEQCARGEANLAEAYGVDQSAIDDFILRHRFEIAHIEQFPDDPYAALWIADKKERIAEYQGHCERIEDWLDAHRESGSRATTSQAELISAQQSALRAVADELGQIPSRVTVATEAKVTHIVEGVDIGALD